MAKGFCHLYCGCPPFLRRLCSALPWILIVSPLMAAPHEGGAGAKRVVVWETKELFRRPKVHVTKERPAKGMRSFFYEGADYKGKSTWVFAYYAAPEGERPAGG